jgi:hypothetical protein
MANGIVNELSNSVKTGRLFLFDDTLSEPQAVWD